VINDSNHFLDEATVSLRELIESKKVFGENVQFLQGILTDITDTEQIRVTLTGDSELEDMEDSLDRKIDYDYLAICTGSNYYLNEQDASSVELLLSKDKRIEFLQKYRESISQTNSILIVGGDSIGVEFLSEIMLLYGKDKKYGIMTEHDALLSQYPASAQKAAMKYFEKRNVQIYTNSRYEAKKELIENYDYVLH
jgi:NADH dehydrogenase FAD-containing subunit